MKRLPGRIHWTIRGRQADNLIELAIGDQQYALTPGEAIELADRLVDRAEKARAQ